MMDGAKETARRLFLLVAFSLCALPLFAYQGQQPTDQQQPAPDNTAVNKRDRDKDAVTADRQKNNASDVEITRKIRRAIAKDKSLSTYAHNVKVITLNGEVTLKGPVRSDTEKSKVEAKAAQVVGAGNVKSELEVAPRRSKTS